MNNEEYMQVMNSIVILKEILMVQDFDGFLRRIGEAEAMGPLIDPTLYKKAGDNLNDIRLVAEAFNTAKRTIEPLINKFKEEVADADGR